MGRLIPDFGLTLLRLAKIAAVHWHHWFRCATGRPIDSPFLSQFFRNHPCQRSTNRIFTISPALAVDSSTFWHGARHAKVAAQVARASKMEVTSSDGKLTAWLRT